MWLFYDNTILGSFCGRDNVILAPVHRNYELVMTTRDFIVDDDYVLQYEVSQHSVTSSRPFQTNGDIFRFPWRARKETPTSLSTFSSPQTMEALGNTQTVSASPSTGYASTQIRRSRPPTLQRQGGVDVQ